MSVAALKSSLGRLARSCGATFCVVFDTGAMVYAAGGDVPYPSDLLRITKRVHDADVRPNTPAMRRGVRLAVARNAEGSRYYVHSFAATYVVLVWFSDSFDEDFVARLVERALPTIKALTLGLPPLGGSGRDGGAMKQRA